MDKRTQRSVTLTEKMVEAALEFQDNVFVKRWLDGKDRKRSRSGATGGFPQYGYRKIGSGSAAMLEIDEVEQAVIRYIKEMRAEGVTFRQMVERLTAEGITQRNGKQWHVGQLHRVVDAKPRATASGESGVLSRSSSSANAENGASPASR
jgi:hypothetical protein